MYRPFAEVFGISVDNGMDYCNDKPKVCRDRTWNEVLSQVKPLKERNFYWKQVPKSPRIERTNPWPPSRLKIRLDLTSEYIEGFQPGTDPILLEMLKAGEFAIQATLNIRGLFVEEAKLAFEEFMRDAILHNYSCVLIIHGRGLSSKGEPVLKKHLKFWLERGPYRKYVLAYCSARACDGGLGATYVLLARKPKSRKKKG